MFSYGLKALTAALALLSTNGFIMSRPSPIKQSLKHRVSSNRVVKTVLNSEPEEPRPIVDISRRKMSGEDSDRDLDFGDFSSSGEELTSDAPPEIGLNEISPDVIDYKPWTGFPKQPLTNNKFLNPDSLSWSDSLTSPDSALTEARRQARLSSNVWLSSSTSSTYNNLKTKNLKGQLAGTYGTVDIDPEILMKMEGTRKILGNAVEPLSSIDGTFRFKYNGPVKHRSGMEAWCTHLLESEGLEVKGVYFECRRTRDSDEY
ncbi:hypothetical protein TrST_g1303 [Triparma strigata]|uniref:Uncharacterized protein n=1 Tax=Triparma strigata TaxID=1606541 RepID=A0A9W7BAQ0_9STRA|nr:hypothetical protein TrST_g1303 [Triparma strigata]